MRDKEKALRRLTFELSGRQRQDARPGLAKMYRVPPDRAWWPAVGAPLERGVRPQLALPGSVIFFIFDFVRVARLETAIGLVRPFRNM